MLTVVDINLSGDTQCGAGFNINYGLSSIQTAVMDVRRQPSVSITQPQIPNPTG